MATGAEPVILPLPNMTLGNITTLHCLADADGIRTLLAEAKPCQVAMVAGGLIGVEPGQARVEGVCRVAVVEMLPQILRMLDWEMARLVEPHTASVY